METVIKTVVGDAAYITEQEFNKRVKLLNDVDLSNIVEQTDETDLSGELACAGGVCEITSL